MSSTKGPGIYDISADEYHSHPAYGSSSIRRFSQGTPKEFIYQESSQREPTEAMKLGTAIHTAILEPHLLSETVVTWTGATRRGKAYEEFKSRNAGKIILTEVQGEVVHAAVKAIQAATSIAKLLSEGESEKSYIAQDPDTGLAIKARPDSRGEIRGKRFLLDVKTIRALDDRTIERAMADHGYGQQAAFYMDTVSLVEKRPVEDFFFLFVKNSMAVDMRFMRPDEEWISVGRERNRRALQGLEKCIRKSEWPGYPPNLEIIPCPTWAINS